MREDSGKPPAVFCLQGDSGLSWGFGLGMRKKVWIPDMPHSKKQMLFYQGGQTQTKEPHPGPGCRNAFSILFLRL